MAIEETRQKLIVVLGMHRSGTSVLSRGLRVFDAEVGNSLIPGEKDSNVKGHWEDADINRINEQVLARLDTAWHRLGYPDESHQLAHDFDDIREEAKTLLRSKIQSLSLYGLKDPRLSILLPFWQPIFNELDLDDRYLIALRNPLDVAKSLEKRDAIPTIKSLLMWAKYTVCALNFTRGKQRTLVRYDSLLESPEAEIKRIAKTLNLDVIIDPKELIDYTAEFLSKDMRHSKSDETALNQSSDIPHYIKQIYKYLLDTSKSQIDLNEQRFIEGWNDIANSYAESTSIFDYIDVLEHERELSNDTLEKERLEFNAELNNIKQQRDDLTSEIKHALEEKDRTLTELNRISNLQEELQVKYQQVLDENDHVVKELQTSEQLQHEYWTLYQNTLAERDNRQESYEELHIAHNKAVAEREIAQKQLNDIYNSRTWLILSGIRSIKYYFVLKPYHVLRRYLSVSIHSLWDRLPGSIEWKIRLKRRLFRTMPFLFRHTVAYKKWMAFEIMPLAISMDMVFVLNTRS